MVDNCIVPRLGTVPLRALRAEHLDRLYGELLDHGGNRQQPLAPKTVYDVHVVIRSCLKDAIRRHYLAINVADSARPPRSQARSRKGPEIWTGDQLRTYLESIHSLRLRPAIYVAAMTGMRRGEVAGLRWGDWDHRRHRLSISRARQVVAGRSIEVPTKTKTSRRSVDIDPATEKVLAQWKRKQAAEGHPVGDSDAMFTNRHGEPVNPESISQLFERKIERAGLPPIRFHDLRHTHASLLLADGTAIKVVSERLGHANPAYTMATY